MGKEIEVPTVSQHFTGSKHVDLEPPAPMAPGLTAKRLRLGYRLSEIFNGYAKESLAKAKESCVWGTCELRLLPSRDDGGDISAAVYHCSKASEEQGCMDRATAAAARVIEQSDAAITAVGRAIDIVAEQGPVEVHVTISHAEPAVTS